MPVQTYDSAANALSSVLHNHVITFASFTANKVSGEASNEIANCSHMMFHLMIANDLLNDCSKINYIINPEWPCDV